MAIKIAGTQAPKNRLLLLVISIVSNFGILFHYKYSSYFGTGLNWIFGQFSLPTIDLASEILPIGLSFHTFQSVSYVIDVYRRKITPERHLGHYACYVLFFPQMVAGPIEKYEHLGLQLKASIKFSGQFIVKALPLLITGLFYKMVLADNCAVYVNAAFQNPTSTAGVTLLVAVLLFCIQIYADFFGYSLIAQGSAALMGIELMNNFEFPLFSSNLFVFWKKWHISLTNWFREYVFFPLGGSRVDAKWKRYRNVLIVFGLSGLWHGAGNNYLLWGLLHGVFYLMVVQKEERAGNIFTTTVKTVFTFFLVALLFLLFRVTDLSVCKTILQRIPFDWQSGTVQSLPYLALAAILFTFLLEYFVRKKSTYHTYFENKPLATYALLFVMLTAIIAFGGIEDLPFIYFQF